jgi:hypothetical protein
VSLKSKIQDIINNNRSESEKENPLRNLLISIPPNEHIEDDLILFRNYYWSKQATQPHTVLILQIIADELDRRSVAKGQLKSDETSKESVRLNKQSNKFALWALIIAGLSLASSLLIPFLIKSQCL